MAQPTGLPPVLQLALRDETTRGGGADGDDSAFGLAWLDVVLAAPDKR